MPSDTAVRTEGRPLATIRPYTAAVKVDDEAARILWQNHVEYNRALAAIADGLVTALAVWLAPDPDGDSTHVLEVVSSWFVAEPASQADPTYVVAPVDIADRFAAHLGAAGFGPRTIAQWLEWALPWIAAPRRDATVWVDRRAKAMSPTCPPVAAGEAVFELVCAPEAGADVTKGVGVWWSRTAGEGKKADWSAAAATTAALVELLERSAGTALSIPFIAEMVVGSSDPADLAHALKTGRGNALSGLVERLGTVGTPDEDAVTRLQTVARGRLEEVSARIAVDADLARLRESGEPTLTDWVRGVLDDHGRSTKHVAVAELLTQAVTVVRSWRTKATDRSLERRDLIATATSTRRAVEIEPIGRLDALCERRGTELGLDHAWLPSRRTIRGWAGAVIAMAMLPPDASDAERVAAALDACSQGDGAFLVSVITGCRDLVDAELARHVGADKTKRSKRRPAPTVLGDYVAWGEALRRLDRFVVPTLTFPDPVEAPRSPWYGNSKPSGSIDKNGTFAVETALGTVGGHWASRRIRRQLVKRASGDGPTVPRDDPRARAAVGAPVGTPVAVGADLGTSAVSLRPDREFLRHVADLGAVDPREVPWGLSAAVNMVGKAPRWLDGRAGERTMAVHFGIRRDATWAIWEVVDDAIVKAAGGALADLDMVKGRLGNKVQHYWRIREDRDEGPHWAVLAERGTISLGEGDVWANDGARDAARTLAGLGLVSDAWNWRDLCDLVTKKEVTRSRLLRAVFGGFRVGVDAQRLLARTLRRVEEEDWADAGESLRKVFTIWPIPGLVEAADGLAATEGRDEVVAALADTFDDRQRQLGRLLSLLRRKVLFGGGQTLTTNDPSLRRVTQYTAYLTAHKAWADTHRPGTPYEPAVLPQGAIAKRLAVRRSWSKLLAAKVVDAALANRAANVVVQDWSGFGPMAGRARSSNALLSTWAIREAIHRLIELAPLHGVPVRQIKVSRVASWDAVGDGPVGTWRMVPAAEAARILASKGWREQLRLARATPAGSFYEERSRQVLAVDRLLRNPALASLHRDISVPIPTEYGPRVARFDAELTIAADGTWSLSTADCDTNTAVYLGRLGILRRKLKREEPEEVAA